MLSSPFENGGNHARAHASAASDSGVTVLAEPSASHRDRPAPIAGRSGASLLARMVPSLLLAHREAAASAKLYPSDEDQVRSFCDLLLAAPYADVQRMIDELEGSGMSGQKVLAEVMAPAARRLGDLWEEDQVTFTDVTLGLCTLHRLLRERRWGGRAVSEPLIGAGGSVCMITLPGDDHIFGAMLVAEMFRLQGWFVSTLIGASHKDLTDKLAQDSLDVLGVSVAFGHSVADVARLIADCRAASSNPDLRVIVGGPAFDHEPDIVERLGADAWIADAESAPVIAAGLRARPTIRS